MELKKSENKNEQLVHMILEGILEKKGMEIVNIDLSKIDHAICDNFIICHGDSSKQISAIANSIEEKVNESLKEKAFNKEGLTNSQWIILDYFTAVVHIFQKEFREFYNLEELWGDGKVIKISESF